MQTKKKLILQTFSYTTIAMGSIFGALAILSRHLDLLDYANILTMTAISNLALIADLGLSPTLRNEIALVDPRDREKIYLSYRKLNRRKMLALSVLAAFLAGYVGFSSLSVSLVLILSATVHAILNINSSFNAQLLVGMGETSFINKKNALQNIVLLSLIIILRNQNIYYIYAAYIFSAAVSSIYVSLSCRKFLKLDCKQENIKLNLGQAVNFSIINIFGSLLFSVDELVVRSMYGELALTSYSPIKRVFILFMTAQGMYLSVYWSKIGEAWYYKHKPDLLRQIKELVLLNFTVTLAMILFVSMFSKLIITTWLGSDQFYNPELVLPFIVFYSLSFNSSSITTTLNALRITDLQRSVSIVFIFLYFPILMIIRQFSQSEAAVIITSCVMSATLILVGALRLYGLLRRDETTFR